MTTKRTRRSEEQMIADLEAKIAAIKAQAERKKLKRDPAIKHITAAVRSIDTALENCEDKATRAALGDARSTLSACLSMLGVGVSSSAGRSGVRGRRSTGEVEGMSDSLLDFVVRNPGQRGEQIAAVLGTDTTTMRLPMKKLIAEKKVKTKGQRRGMMYFAV